LKEGEKVKVILLKDSGKLGKQGDVVNVKDGYGRNFLIPQGIALSASDKNFNRLQDIQKAKVKVLAHQREKSLKFKEVIEKTSVTITVEAKDDETLYGAVSEAQILKQCKAEGLELEKSQLVIDEPILRLGVYNLKTNLCEGVQATLRLWVVKK
jgi:large subunit ribosomal protein L9